MSTMPRKPHTSDLLEHLQPLVWCGVVVLTHRPIQYNHIGTRGKGEPVSTQRRVMQVVFRMWRITAS
jgi:hypothetical protein